jgi:hypothetical protein
MILMLMDLAPAPSAGDLALLPIIIVLGVILVLSVTFLALLVFFLIRYKRRQLNSPVQPEPAPRVE